MFFPSLYIDYKQYNIVDVVRCYTGVQGTISRIFVNGVPFCFGLEPKDFEFAKQKLNVTQIKSFKTKTYNEKGLFCAIPAGIYDLDLKHKSSKWFYKDQYKCSGGFVPEVMNIPGYAGVCIHIGNTIRDTSGCLVVGNEFSRTSVYNSTVTFAKLYATLDAFKYPIKIRYSDTYVY